MWWVEISLFWLAILSLYLLFDLMFLFLAWIYCSVALVFEVWDSGLDVSAVFLLSSALVVLVGCQVLVALS